MTKQNMIPKPLFAATISAMQHQRILDKGTDKIIGEAFDAPSGLLDNSILYNAICDLLNHFFPKDDVNCPIRHYCFEMDFGAIDIENGEFVSAEDFYDSLVNGDFYDARD